MKVDLILSGGAARGIAHIGVLKALEDLGIDVDVISCVSAGAIVGIFYSAGYKPEEMMGLLKEVNWFTLLRPKIPGLGFVSFRKAERKLRELIDFEKLEDLPKRVYVCSLDIRSGETLYFSKGDLVPILLGSCALPGIFEPVAYNKYLLVDGGITDNLPVKPLIGKKNIKVGVEVNPLYFEREPTNVISILIRSFLLAVRSNVNKSKEMCDIVIEPDLRGYSYLDVGKMDEIYEIGYRSAYKIMEDYVRKK